MDCGWFFTGEWLGKVELKDDVDCWYLLWPSPKSFIKFENNLAEKKLHWGFLTGDLKYEIIYDILDPDGSLLERYSEDFMKIQNLLFLCSCHDVATSGTTNVCVCVFVCICVSVFVSINSKSSWVILIKFDRMTHYDKKLDSFRRWDKLLT